MIVKDVKILILVKTYPSLSKKYGELVCTAGIDEDGKWIRLYPIPFRLLEYEKRYKKYQWIKAKIGKNKSDPRPESHIIIDNNSIKLLDVVDTEDKWAKRKALLKKTPIYNDISQLIEKANKNILSLAIFKPEEIIDLKIEETDREWDKEKIKQIEQNNKQLELFSSEEEIYFKETFELVKKIPYIFSYTFTDIKGKKSTLMIEDWEIGQLYWNCLKRSNNNEKKALELVKNKYLKEFQKKDILFFLGTTRQHHGRAKNPFVIIGVFYPPKKILTNNTFF
ncbi:MAG: hypothetical protein AB1444_10050 [Spirochaetota bacterium]